MCVHLRSVSDCKVKLQASLGLGGSRVIFGSYCMQSSGKSCPDNIGQIEFRSSHRRCCSFHFARERERIIRCSLFYVQWSDSSSLGAQIMWKNFAPCPSESHLLKLLLQFAFYYMLCCSIFFPMRYWGDINDINDIIPCFELTFKDSGSSWRWCSSGKNSSNESAYIPASLLTGWAASENSS